MGNRRSEFIADEQWWTGCHEDLKRVEASLMGAVAELESQARVSALDESRETIGVLRRGIPDVIKMLREVLETASTCDRVFRARSSLILE